MTSYDTAVEEVFNLYTAYEGADSGENTMSEEMINVPMTREELRLLAFLLNRGVRETRDLQEMGLVEEASFVCRLVGAKAGDTVRWDEKLLRRLGKWVDEDPNGEDGE